MVRQTYPQSGDSTTPSDLLSAEGMAAYGGRSNSSDYVETGLQITGLDFTTTPKTFDISTGKAFVIVDSLTDSNGEAWLVCDLLAQFDGGTHALEDGNINTVWAWAKQDIDDSAEIVVNTTGVAPGDDAILIAAVDPAAEPTINAAVTLHNRAPDARFETVDTDSLTAREITIGGETFTTIPLTADSTVPRINSAYDDEVPREDGDPKRYVRKARSADTAGTAEGITNNLYQDIAEYVQNYLEERNLVNPWNQIHLGSDANTNRVGEDSVTVPRYDQYRITVHGENHREDRSQELYVRLNNYSGSDYLQAVWDMGGPNSSRDISRSFQEDNFGTIWRNEWDILSIPPGSEAVSQAYINRPRATASSRAVKRYPTFGNSYMAFNVEVANITQFGALRKTMQRIDSLQLRTFAPVTGSWVVEGRNFPWNQ